MRIKNENYITVMGFMRKDLGLKKLELLVFAIIYGFCQEENSCYSGSIGYLCDWVGCSKNTILTILKSLESKGYIIKKDIPVSTNVKTCEYRINYDAVFKNCTTGAEIEPNRIYTFNNTNNNMTIYKNIIDYMNSVLGSKFKPGVQKTKSLIDARIKEGFTYEDFCTVIDYKYKEWHEDKKMREYLRPITLFGTKFESYLNSAPKKPKYIEPEPIEEEPEMSDEEWLEMMKASDNE